jgi:hypothetical protein
MILAISNNKVDSSGKNKNKTVKLFEPMKKVKKILKNKKKGRFSKDPKNEQNANLSF